MTNLPAVLERGEQAVPEPRTPAILDADYRELSRMPMGTRDRRRSRSVVLPAALLALAILAAPVAVYAVLVWSSQP